VYGLSFASITCVLVHVYLWHGKDLLDAVRGRQKLDIHGRLIRSYKQIPWWWNAILLLIFTALSIVLVEVFNTELPVYGVFLALVIPAVFMVPCGIIQGITNVDANQLNVLSEFIGGYMFQGKPLANMVFKVLSEDVVSQGKAVSLFLRAYLPNLRGLELNWVRYLLRPRPETWPLLQGGASHGLLRPRLRHYPWLAHTNWCYTLDAR
jgi:hypothetical protein